MQTDAKHQQNDAQFSRSGASLVSATKPGVNGPASTPLTDIPPEEKYVVYWPACRGKGEHKAANNGGDKRGGVMHSSPFPGGYCPFLAGKTKITGIVYDNFIDDVHE